MNIDQRSPRDTHTKHDADMVLQRKTTPSLDNKPEKASWFIRLLQGPYAYIATIVIAFCESSFFPIPPDVGMISVILHDRSKAWRLAFWCSIASILGGLVGYAIGAFLFEKIGHSIIAFYGLEERFATLKDDFHHYGFWIILLKGLTPIPYKLVTIASGVFKFSLWQFIIASIITRAGRFFLLALGLYYLGPLAKPYFERVIGWATLIVIVVVAIGFILIKFL